MSVADFQAPDAPGFKLDPRVVGSFTRFAGGYWRGSKALQAWSLSIGLALCLLASTGATVALNQWNRWFFDGLEARNVSVITTAVFLFAGIIATMAAIGVVIVYTREALQVRWRAWLVNELVGRWLDRQRFYHLNVTGKEPPNPEYRISDDTRWATEPLVDLAIGLVLALAGASAFISILWSVGGSISVPVGGGQVVVPAYMVWVALAYGTIASGLMLWVGGPLVGYVGRKNEAEGYFRFAMMRIRDNAESVALMKGGPYERAVLGRFYDAVVNRWMAVVRQHAKLTWITNASGPMIPIVPLLFAAPKYISGDLTLGQVTQLAAAFVQVQIAISWVVDNYNRVAEWYASARRVMDIIDACEAMDRELAARPETVQGGASSSLSFSDFEVSDSSGRPLVSGTGLTAGAGESVHIAGDSSTGKSTLVRVLAGLTPLARGSLKAPPEDGVMIAPQKGYLPLGSLRGALAYPVASLRLADDEVRRVLARVGLETLSSRLDEVARWDQVLSNGERQRLAIARLMLHKPAVVVLDDALAALEEPAQQALLARLRQDLPAATIVSLGQRPAAGGRHDRELVLERSGHQARLVPSRPPAALADVK
ncbi:MAG: ABC transporter ATP-binding protein/permease [Hyphomicrobiaceae bacterium]|nr:ABC transporter ATP-binding protein/permease [Hyphomicrobiaceae bacterium]